MTSRRAARSAALAAALVATCLPAALRAHPLDAATLTLTEVQPGRFAVRFRAGSAALQRDLSAPARFPRSCRMESGLLACDPAGLSGEMEFPWLEGTLTHLLVQIDWMGGSRLQRLVTASSPRLTLYSSMSGAGSWRTVVGDYTSLGVEHILTGYDHLLFVVALTLLVRRGRLLFTTITAFTVAHSVTLAATVLGLVDVPSAPVEATIALSIVLVCAECLRPAHSLTRRAPWLVAFTFGLLHGLGFASALLEIGLPERHVPAALLCFNLGVELGQLAAIAGVIALRALAARFCRTRPWAGRAVVYAMGAVAAFWSLDRVAAVFQP